MPFQIESKTRVTVTSVAIRGEHHGPEIAPGVTLSLKMVVGNDWLANLSGHLKGSFYMAGESTAQQPELPGTEESDMPILRMPDAGALPWEKEYTGLELVIDHGIGGASDIVVSDCKVDSIVLDFQQGGSVEVEFKVKSNAADERTRGQLTSTIKQDIEVEVYGPDVDDRQADIEDKPATSKPKAKDATGAFLDAHG